VCANSAHRARMQLLPAKKHAPTGVKRRDAVDRNSYSDIVF